MISHTARLTPYRSQNLIWHIYYITITVIPDFRADPARIYNIKLFQRTPRRSSPKNKSQVVATERGICASVCQRFNEVKAFVMQTISLDVICCWCTVTINSRCPFSSLNIWTKAGKSLLFGFPHNLPHLCYITVRKEVECTCLYFYHNYIITTTSTCRCAGVMVANVGTQTHLTGQMFLLDGLWKNLSVYTDSDTDGLNHPRGISGPDSKGHSTITVLSINGKTWFVLIKPGVGLYILY